MMRDEDGTAPALHAFYRILVAVCAALAIVIAGGTAFSLISRAGNDKSVKPAAEEPALPGTDLAGTAAKAEPGTSYYTGIGRIRAASADKTPAVIVVSITFPFDRADSAFSEELAAKTKEFRKLALDYFSSFTIAALRSTPEETLKGELARRYNAILRLGKIEAIFFDDYMLID